MIFRSTRTEPLMLILLAVFLVGNLPVCRGGCNRSSGPSGSTECVLISPYYSKRQWSTCLTDTYIRLQSGGKHKCRDSYASYCWYQCMLETHNIDQGNVYQDCQCNTSVITSTPRPLPSRCYSPTGTDCKWYDICLNAKYHCNETPISFGKKFCSFSSYSRYLTSTGRRWADSVRKCLLVALAPAMRQYGNYTCRKIRDNAVGSQKRCYLTPYTGSPSVCSLYSTDWWKSFWTLKGNISHGYDSSLKGMLDTKKGCKYPYITRYNSHIRYIRLKVRTSPQLFISNTHSFAGNVSDAIANTYRWSSKGIIWFAYSQRAWDGWVEILIIISNKYYYNLALRAFNNRKVNLDSTVTEIKLLVKAGSLNVSVPVLQCDECVDIDCNRTKSRAMPTTLTTPRYPTVSTSPTGSNISSCNPYTGPSGVTACVLLTPHYSQKQWSTCLSNTYIKLKSGGKHRCRNLAAKYCWYQCMIETYNKSSGAVYSDCRCSSDMTTPTPVRQTISAAPWCSSPLGENCDWYAQCFEAKYRCDEYSQTPAVRYAKKFCSLNSYNYFQLLNVNGQMWINAVRKCLEVALVPFLRPWVSATCEKVQKEALHSQGQCYRTPFSTAPSICDIISNDWWTVFWTMKGNYKEAYNLNLKDMLQTRTGCSNRNIKSLSEGIKLIRLKVQRSSNVYSNQDMYAGDVADAIAENYDWKSKGVIWFAYAKLSLKTYPDVHYIFIFIADRNGFNLDSMSPKTVNLNSVMAAISKNMKNGLRFRIRHSHDFVTVTEMQECGNMDCSKISSSISPYCNPKYGPSGKRKCVKLEEYYSNQWSVCATNKYIRLKTRGKHGCKNGETFCWYQCMLELHDKEEGYVSEDCRCNSWQTTTMRSVPAIVLPTWCLSPTGKDCSWYLTCFKKKYPCLNDAEHFSTTFAEKFCHLYSQSLKNFTRVGVTWVDAVRKCLQVSMVPLLRQWVSFDCHEIQRKALESHTACFRSPYTGAPSLCDITRDEWWKVFWTVRDTYYRASDRSLKGLLSTAEGCSHRNLMLLTDGVRYLRLSILKHGYRPIVDADTYAGHVADAIAKKAGWPRAGLDWYAYAAHDKGRSKNVTTIFVIIGDKYAYNLDIKIPRHVRVNLSKTVMTLAKHVKQGKLNSKILSGTEAFDVMRLEGCVDISCAKVYLNVTGKVSTSSSSLPSVTNILSLVCLSVFIFAIFE